MNNKKQTYKDICEIAKLLELGKSKQAGEAWETKYLECSLFLESSSRTIIDKYGYDDSLKTKIAWCLDRFAGDVDYAIDMFEGNFDERWSYIAKKAKKHELLLALKAFGQMEDFEELIKGPKPLTPEQRAEIHAKWLESVNSGDTSDEIQIPEINVTNKNKKGE